ncbi:RNA-binding protein [Aeromicrobium sp. 636]|uniref:CGNR zinc finger domain-containing protein n=1 Tax=Aeromicrobium senzhongii TaxID=2663859 RepID=A0A8I0K0C6_9ACTN|nr:MULTISPECIES: CGNR zinc finger domain-containing protein [Aeromicrobium]MBC9226221.1 CGNR zinc finger domain-containing protein [Aeromicrobium senzhongii]MCQ3998327.1 RNA-binding protein [Aeromicrobium sp. 636]MTB88756.1 RNA-binding protein [Aeromicrobium senzhongii]QNL93949.1 CGNR zinc finger domain-containing protein [Aeromicrobium senzhongii]
MAFTPDVADALGAAAELANSADEPDTLEAVEDLTEFFDRWEYTGARPRSRDDLEAVRGIRARLRELLTADRAAAVDLVNAVLAEQQAVPRLVRHDHLDWHVHAIADDRPLHERILVETAMAMIDLIRADDLGRIGRCAASDCDGVVVDLSRNRSRKFCSTTCGNREAQAAYRARQG